MSARDDAFTELTLPELARRVANTVRYGHVMEVDHATRRVRVKSGDIETTWLRWSAGRAGAGKRRWDPPEVGEQCVMLAPTGDLRQATVMPGEYQDAHDAPSSDPNEDVAEYGDGAVIGYNRETHTLTADLGGTSVIADRDHIELKVGGFTVSVTGTAITLTAGGTTLTLGAGGAAFTGTTLTHNGKNVGDTHTHIGSPTANVGPQSPTGVPN